MPVCIGSDDVLPNRRQAGWRHQMESFSALLALCAGNSPVAGEYPSQRPVTRSFDVFFDLRLNKLLSKQSRRWWCETPSCSLWRHCNETKSKPMMAFFNPRIYTTLKRRRPKCRDIDRARSNDVGWPVTVTSYKRRGVSNHGQFDPLLRVKNDYLSRLCEWVVISLTKSPKGQKRGKCFHIMTSSCVHVKRAPSLCLRTGSALVQIMACRLFGANPLP